MNEIKVVKNHFGFWTVSGQIVIRRMKHVRCLLTACSVIGGFLCFYHRISSKSFTRDLRIKPYYATCLIRKIHEKPLKLYRRQHGIFN